MSTPLIQLVPLMCIQCRQPIPAQPGEVAWVCGFCQAGMLLGSDTVVRPLEVLFSPDLRPGVKGRPFWVAQGQVTISDRQTYKGNEARESTAFWSGERLFCIPAYALSLEELIATGMRMLRQNPPQTAPGGGAAFLPVVTPPEDMHPLAEFIVLALEADRRDALKTVKFNLSLQNPRLWILP